MLIFILQKDELKEDEHLYQSVIRSQIDIRVKGLGLYCKEFVKKVDTDREEFKNFHSLMNERNNILHGNVDPMKFSLGEVFFDDNTFVGKEQQSFSERALKNVLRYVEPESALQDVKVVREFVDFVLEHIEPSLIDPIKMVLDCDHPGWHENNRHVAVLFPQHVAESFIGLG